MAKKNVPTDGLDQYDANSLDFQEMLYARHAEIKNFEDLELQRGTPIPAVYNQFYKFIQNPSSVSVETFKRMIDTDDTIGSGVDFLTTCLAARLGRFRHTSKEISEFVNKRLDEIEGGWTNLVKEMLSASWAGFYAGEKVWANTVNGFTINHIAPLPPTTILFEVDRTGRLTEDGILQYQRSWNPYSLAYGVSMYAGALGSPGFSGQNSRPDPWARLGDLPFPLRTGNTFNYMCVRIPRMKVVHYAFDAQGKFGNPYGRSLLRRAYKWWVLKDGIARMMSIALDRKGTPLTVVYVDPNATVIDPSKVVQGQGNGGNQRGRQVGMRLDLAVKEAFKNIHNDSVIILPGKKDSMVGVESITQDANAESFMTALDFCNKSCLRAMLIPALIFGGGDGTGSYSLGQEHAKTFDKILDGMLSGLKQTLLEQVVKELIAYNFPKSAWEKEGVGDFGQRELSNDERQKEMEVCDKAVNMGAVDLNDLNDLNTIRQKAGFQERDEIIERIEDPLGDGMGELGNDDEDRQEDRQEEKPKAKEEKKPAKAARRRKR